MTSKKKPRLAPGFNNVKDRKQHNTTAELIPGLLDGSETASSYDSRKVSVAKRTRLRLFRLETPKEKAALRRLCSRVTHKRAFQSLVRAYLQQVADLASPLRDVEPRPTRVKPSQSVRVLQRAAKKVRKFEKWVKKPMAVEWPAGRGLQPIMPGRVEPPIRELICYADYLEECAKRFYSAPIKPPRHKPRPETRSIVRLAEFIKQTTGQNYWGSLAILLRRPTRDKVTKKSLYELVEFYRTKFRKSRFYSAFWHASH